MSWREESRREAGFRYWGGREGGRGRGREGRREREREGEGEREGGRGKEREREKREKETKRFAMCSKYIHKHTKIMHTCIHVYTVQIKCKVHVHV